MEWQAKFRVQNGDRVQVKPGHAGSIMAEMKPNQHCEGLDY